MGAATAGAWLLVASSVSTVSIASVSTPPAWAAVGVETSFGAAGSGGAGCPSWALTSAGPSSPAHRTSNRARHRSEFCGLFRKQPPQSSVGPYLSIKARVMYLRRTTTSPGRASQGVPVTIFRALSFQRLPSTFRRTDRAKTAPVSKPMLCSSLRSDSPSQIAVRQWSSRFREISGLGQLVPNRPFRVSICQLCIHVP